jgi:hypothetical protein
MHRRRVMGFLALLGAFLGLLGGQSWAAVTPNSPVFMQTPTVGKVQFLQGTDSAGTYKTLYTAGTNGARCNALWLTTDDGTTTHLVTVQIVSGGIRFGGVAVTTTISQGFASGTPALNVLAPTLWPGLPLDSDGNPYIQLASGDTLQATYTTALTAATRISLVTSCGEF